MTVGREVGTDGDGLLEPLRGFFFLREESYKGFQINQ